MGLFSQLSSRDKHYYIPMDSGKVKTTAAFVGSKNSFPFYIIFFSSTISFLQTMNVSMDESKISNKIFIEPSIRVLNLEGEEKDGTGIFDNSASIQNPNKDDSRRLFQVYKPDFTWDPSMPYDELPIRLEQEGPVPLDFPGYFYDVEAGISVIYWEEDRSRGCLCTILGTNELDETFTYQALSWQGKKKSTFFDTGRTMEANESKVWRLVYRAEF